MLKRVLFLCTNNSYRSQMADGIINHDFAGQIRKQFGDFLGLQLQQMPGNL